MVDPSLSAQRMAIVFCVEAGALEQQAVLLAQSVRTWTGPYRDVALHAYAPRPGHRPSAETIAQLEALGVVVIADDLNTALDYYPHSNKLFACAHAETHLNVETIVFSDTDTVFLNPPEVLELPENVDLALQPVVTGNQASRGEGSRFDDYWLRVYALFDIEAGAFVTTMQHRRRVRPYFNAGLISFRRQLGLCGAWLEMLQRLVAAELVPPRGITTVDQISLAALATPRMDRVRMLDFRYNYPLPRRAVLHGAMRTVPLDELVHVHYHRWFNRPGFLAALRPRLDRNSARYRWLEGFLPFTPTIREPLHGSLRKRMWQWWK